MSDLTIGIMGTGNIGNAVAEKIKCLGAKVVGFKRTKPETRNDAIDDYFVLEQLDDFLKSCDYICNILPSTPHTVNLLSGKF